MDPIVDPVHGLPLWTTPNFKDEFFERSKLILRTLNGRNCVNKWYFLSGFWSPHIGHLFQFFLNSIPKEWKRSREEVVFLCSFSVSLCCVTTQQLCRRLGHEEVIKACWLSTILRLPFPWKRLEMFVCLQTSWILLLVWIKHKMTTYFQKHGLSDI